MQAGRLGENKRDDLLTSTRTPLLKRKASRSISHRVRVTFVRQVVAIAALGIAAMIFATVAAENLMAYQVVNDAAAKFAETLERDPAAEPPLGPYVRGYLSRPGRPANLPESIAEYGPGFHTRGKQNLSVTIVDLPAGRLYFTYDRRALDHIIYSIVASIIGICIVVMAWIAWLAYRASRRALQPVVALAELVRNWDPKSEHGGPFIPEAFLEAGSANNGDIASLATALRGLGMRLDAFVHRERNFTRDASHELRTPVTVVKVGAETMLEDEELPLYARKTLLRIRRASRDMEALIESFLILAREEGSGLPQQDITVNQIVREEIELARALVDQKRVLLRVDEEAVIQLHTSPRALSVLLGNLIRNACAYTERGEITVTIGRRELSVRDTGIGMSEDELAQLRTSDDPVGSSRGQGHGIGLSIVKRLADRFGWSVEISSALGKGTCARVVFEQALPVA